MPKYRNGDIKKNILLSVNYLIVCYFNLDLIYISDIENSFKRTQLSEHLCDQSAFSREKMEKTD